MAFIQLHNREEGFVMVACLMIMVVLTIVGIMAVSTTQIELQVSGNDKVAKSAFYRADSGTYSAPKVIRNAIEVGSGMNITTMQLDAGTWGEFYRKMMGYVNPPNNVGNVAFTQGQGNINAGITRSGEEQLPGESVEFASGYDGGPSGSQGVGLLYSLATRGTAPGNAVSQISALYRFIPGRPGGL